MIVVDASVMVAALGDAGPLGERARSALADPEQHAPHLIDLEVASAVRSLVARGRLSARHGQAVLDGLTVYPLRRHAHTGVLGRVWEMRENVTPYDAAYVALAEALGATLVTADARLARAPGRRCPVTVVA